MMKSCRKWRSHLVDAVYGEIGGRRAAELEAHLETCPGCAAELESLRTTSRTVTEMLPPRPEKLDVWRRIAPEIAALDSAANERPRLVLGYGAAAALATALVVLGLGLGILLRTPTAVSPTPAALTTVAATAIVDEAPASVDAHFARFLERATPLLLAVANRQTGTTEVGSFDPAAERRLAERLAADAARLANELETAGRGRQAALADDLGVVFLQMSNLPERQYRRGIEVVRATIESRALLFQLSVEEMRHL